MTTAELAKAVADVHAIREYAEMVPAQFAALVCWAYGHVPEGRVPNAGPAQADCVRCGEHVEEAYG